MRNPHSSREGYLMVDHRSSPGLPADLVRRMNLDPKQYAEGQLFESATLTCAHCKVVVVKNALRTRERSNCPACGWRYVCDVCAFAMTKSDYKHLPFEGLIEIERAFHDNKGLQKFLGTPQQLLELAQKGQVPELDPLGVKAPPVAPPAEPVQAPSDAVNAAPAPAVAQPAPQDPVTAIGPTDRPL